MYEFQFQVISISLVKENTVERDLIYADACGGYMWWVKETETQRHGRAEHVRMCVHAIVSSGCYNKIPKTMQLKWLKENSSYGFERLRNLS